MIVGMASELRIPDAPDEQGAPNVRSAHVLMQLGDPGEPRRFVGFVELDVGAERARFHLKRYAYATWRESLGLLGRGTLWGTAPELAEYEALRVLARHGVPAVRPAAACAITSWGRLVGHALLTHAAPPGALALETRLRDPQDPLLGDRGWRRACFRLLGSTLAKMHAIPFVHRDLRARNVLVGADAHGAPALWMLDCRKGGPGGARDRALDLASLDRDLIGRVPRGDRMTALRAYRVPGGARGALVARIARLRAAVPAPRAV